MSSRSSDPALLARARVLLVGLEAWGVIAAVDLAEAGLGAIHLLEDGPVTGDDLLAVRVLDEADRGRSRVAALRGALARAAPGCEVTSGPLVAAPDRALALDDGRWDLVVACVPADDLLVLSSAARFAHATGTVSVSAHLDGLTAVIGPAVVPGETACWSCCRLRRLATSDRREADGALQRALLAERPPRRARATLAPSAGLLGHALALAAFSLLAAPRASPLAGRILLRSFTDLSTSMHTVLRLPSCEVCGGARAADRRAPEGSGVRLDAARDPAELRRLLAGVVDPCTGIVRSLVLESPSPVTYPEAPRTAMAALSAPPDGHDHTCQPQVGAGKGASAVEALIGAVGEAVERYSASRVDPGAIVRASPAEMTRDHIPPERLALYDERQYARPDFPYARLDAGAPLDWVRGRWLDGGSAVYVPALPAFFDYPAPPEESFCQVTSNGLAAGATLADASLRAALELIERDAFMISWLARLPGRRIHLDASVDPDAREVARQLEERGARIELHLLDVGTAVPTVLCVAFGDGRRWPGATVAMGAHPSPRRAIRKALLEQGHVGPYLHRLMIEGDRPVPGTPEEVRTLDDHARYYFPPARAEAFAFLGGGGETGAGDLEEPEDPSLDLVVDRLRRAHLRVAIVDLTSPDLDPTPFRVARALGLDFQQIHFGHALGRLGNPRLLAVAHRGLNPDPHPMA